MGHMKRDHKPRRWPRAAGLTKSKLFDGSKLITPVSHSLAKWRMVIKGGADSGALVDVATGTIG